jgi:hypothetical protein
LAATTVLLSPSFAVGTSVVNGIHKIPDQFSGGEGSARDEEVPFDITSGPPGVDERELSLASTASPTARNAFESGLQTWTRNSGLTTHDWLRIGTDVLRRSYDE